VDNHDNFSGISAAQKDSQLRPIAQTLLRLLTGSYFLFSSLYCLLAFLPYTYCAFIKAPPYPAMPWFAHHQALLYWLAAAAGLVASDYVWKRSKPSRTTLGLAIAVVAFGIYVSGRPFLASLQSDGTAYWWSLASLLPLIALTLLSGHAPKPNDDSERHPALFKYSLGVVVALVVSAVYVVSSRIQVYGETRKVAFSAQFLNAVAWSIISHLTVALIVLSILNLIRVVASRCRKPGLYRQWLLGICITIVLGFAMARFLDSAMSFDGWGAYVYAFALSGTVTLWGFSIALPLRPPKSSSEELGWWQKATTWVILALLVGLSLASHSLIGGEDWNGLVASTWVGFFWIAISLCIARLQPRRAAYPIASVLGILVAGVLLYEGVQFTKILWSKALGSTDDEISLNLEEYGARDASFQFAHHLLGNGRHEKCGELCRILREYTNVRDTHISQGVRLVDHLLPAQGETPNIFIFVVDSMRADYLGAYNPGVDYTPHLDSLARDSITFHHAYTHYAGTSLSEPSIWAGAELLHAHFPQPFDEVNSLRMLAKTDGYELVVSYDSVLRQLFSASDTVTKLDIDKDTWNRFEACSTIAELESHLDGRQNKNQPVLFYAQPMNVHQFARNDVPSPNSQHWPERPGMTRRITYEVHWVDSCLGGFLDYLKQQGMYDDSVIIVASDHGDATGEFGRSSHSTLIWPEIIRVPLIVHVPQRMRSRLIYDDTRLSTLSDIAPTLYYLLGHRPILQHPLFGRPLLAETKRELDAYPQEDLFLASDVRAVYGVLSADGRYLYTTYDSPDQSYLFDLSIDPNAQHSILTPALKRHYDEQILDRLQFIGNYYGYKPGVGSLLASASR